MIWPTVAAGMLFGALLGALACGGEGAPSAAERVPVTESAGTPNAADPARGLSVQELVPLLTRYGVGPNGVGIDLIYAPQLFFDVTGSAPPAEAEARPTLVFVLQENIHEGELGDRPPVAFLLLSDGTRFPPYEATVKTADPHHRASLLLFPRPSDWPASPSNSDRLTLRVVVPMDDGSVSVANTFEWQLPLDAPGDAAQPGGG